MKNKVDLNEKRIKEIEEEISFYERSLSSEIDGSLKNFKKIAIIGSIITVGYAITKLLVNPKSPPEDLSEDNKTSFIGKTAKGLFSTLVLSILKNRLTKLIEDYNYNEERNS